MNDLPSIAFLGLALGMRHATDADHVIAVTTIVSERGKAGGAALIGALWGLGHTTTILLLGGAIIVFEWVIPPRVGLALEFAVGIMLVLLGLLALRRRSHAPAPTSTRHRHARPFGIGLVHGLAGSAAVAFLVLATISDTRWAMAYLALFGVGTLIGMAIITAVLALPFRSGHLASTRWLHAFRIGAGVLSLGFGLMLMYEIGVNNHLFGGTPIWTPR
ncbi:MAG: high-affinity nickel-transport family protein [Gemmatimonadota bacterium]